MKRILLSLLFALFLLPLAVMGQCGSGLSVIDADGNSYATLKVGPYCWMQSNLKTRVPGSSIYWADMYPDTSANLDIYGRLYNWYAAMNIQPGETPVVSEHGFVQGVCPSGWHLPTADEISHLATYSVPGLHDTHYWMVPGTNTTAYTMRPGGFYNASKNRSEDLCGNSYMWTAQSLDPLSPSIVWSDCYCDHFVVDESAAGNGLSVRCVLGVFQAEVQTYAATNVKSNQADLNGEVFFAGLDENYTRGFVYGTDSEHLTVDTAQTGQSEEGTYSFTIYDLAENTTYYYRAYVVNAFGIAYGELKSFTTTNMKVETFDENVATMYTAKVYGNVLNMGGYGSLNAGFLYGTDRSALTETAQHEQAILSLGNYSCNLNGLMPDTKYYYCAYLTNGRQAVYGDTLDFTTAYMNVETAPATEVTYNSATLNGKLTDLRNYSENICGVVFRYGQRKDMLNHYSGGSTMDSPGDINNSVSNLSPSTTYYFQALAIHGTDTVWAADTLSFSTPTVPCPGAKRANEHATELGIDSVLDVDGNAYITLQIGSQCWMAQNLKTTKYADGTSISFGGTTTSSTMPYRYFPGGDTNNVNTYGHLYNWMAVMNGAESSNTNPSGVQGICPDGWHVPSEVEWTQLTSYVNGVADYKCGGQNNAIAKALASTTGWNTSETSCHVGNDLSANNATGFNAVPAGNYIGGQPNNFGQGASFWPATKFDATNAYGRYLNYQISDVRLSYYNYHHGRSVRCLRDPMTVTTDSANTVTSNSATLYGNVTSLGKYTTVKAGFRYGTSANALNKRTDDTTMTANGIYSVAMTTLAPNSTYYYQAYAYNGTDTVYGKVMDFTTTTVYCPGAKRANEHATELGIDSVSDVDGNAYITLQIGNQCWMAENLRTNVGGGVYPKNGDQTVTGEDTVIYGRLYDWAAVMQGAPSSDAVPSGVQGICPEGWHVPSVAEFDMLTTYVRSKTEYHCGSSVDNIANALSAPTEWNNHNTCTPGDGTSTTSNLTGFSAVPAGGWYPSYFYDFGRNAYFWVATQSGPDHAHFRYLFFETSIVYANTILKGNGYSVRCLRDPMTVTTDSVKEVTHNSATIYGNVKSLGKYDEVKAGFRYGTSADALNKRTDDTTMTANGIYSVAMTTLAPNSTYYFQAYACNGTDTVYGKVMDFTTTTVYCPGVKKANEHATELGIDSVSDVDGNSYATVLIGNQCWMAQNLRTTKYADGTAIEHGTDTSSVKAYRYFPANDTNNVNTYGHLYNWMAVMNGAESSNTNPSGVQGICPEGWHVPSDVEWTALTNYVNSKSEYRCGGNSTIANALSSTTGWSSNTSEGCGAGNMGDKSNLTGFSAVPAGSYNRGYGALGNDAYIYSATQTDSILANYFNLYKGYAYVSFSKKIKTYGYSVRCLRDPLTVTTDSANTVTNNSATIYGNVTNMGKYTEVKAGFRYGQLINNMVSYTEKADTITATGIYNVDLSDLTPNTTYYYQAYACNGTDTVYGKVMDFTTTTVYCPGAKRANEHATELGIDSVSDVDGNSYATVLIGNQCWMAQNLRTITNPNSKGKIFTPNKNGYDTTIYGRLYDWAAVMQGAPSSNAVPSGVQGICPEGWHVPSDEEFHQLIFFMADVADFKCGSGYLPLAKALASATGWNTSETSCHVGNDLSSNNATGFSAVPAGYYLSAGHVEFGNEAHFWTSYSTSSVGAQLLKITYNSEGGSSFYEYNSMSVGYSVRCLRDPLTATTDSVSGVTTSDATIYGNVTSLGKYTTVKAGFRYGTSADALTNRTADTTMTANGIYSVAMTGLAENAPYYFQIYAYNGTDTVYGEVVDFKTASDKHCPGIYTVADHEGNMYNTVQIGSQCWMAENMRCTTSPNGSLQKGETNSSSPKYYTISNTTLTLRESGLLYNWYGALDTTCNTSYTNRRGICPEGWHVPTHEEWTQLTNYVNSVTDYKCGGQNDDIAKALASATGWNTSEISCAVGNDLSANNATGFSAVPAYSSNANFWSATQYSGNSDYAYCRSLYDNASYVHTHNAEKVNRFSVRCLLDPLTVVTSDSVSSITDSSATCGGNVKADGGSEVTARGVCWSMSQNPTIADSHTTDGTGKGSFTSTMKGLKPNNTYYVRAYAINGTDTMYGSQLRFLTKAGPCPGTPTVTDIDNNTYNTVQIGNQCWMKENLRTTKKPNNEDITEGMWNPGGNSVETYGRLYSWTTMMNGATTSNANPSGVQGICPEGWHVPSDAECTQLTTYVKNQSEYVCGSDKTYIAKALASTTGWSTNETPCAVGNDLSANNATGFSALPAGVILKNGDHSGGSASISSATQSNNNTSDAYYYYFKAISKVVDNAPGPKDCGLSVRCLRDPLTVVTNDSVSSITDSSATCGGNVKADGGAEVTARGVCWSTSPNPTIADSHTTDGTGLGSFTSSLKGLKPNITYYVRAYAINSEGTTYGSELSFLTKAGPCSNTPTVTDIDGNTYNTVQIGSQCWMKENLRTTRYADGTYIEKGTATSTSAPYRYFPGNDTNNVNTYGHLYNWIAAMNGAESSEANPSGVQGICPVGWHVPSDAEWTQLTTYVNSVTDYKCGGQNDAIANALSSSTGWTTPNECCAGHNSTTLNKTGFAAVPAGTYYSSGPIGFNYRAYFWSATENGGNALYRNLVSSVSVVYRASLDKLYGFSVRCLHDPLTVVTETPSSITDSSATCGGEVIADEGVTVTARGVCWSTSPNPTIADSHTTDGSSTGSFTSNMTGLTPNATYYVRAYATSSVETIYGSQVSFTAKHKPCHGTPTVTDIDGNTYNTVQIGNQCWMKENLRTTRKPNNETITEGMWNPGDNSVETYGRFYSWTTVMNGATSSDANPSGVQGICPTGWHVPSDAEWSQLTDYVASQSQYVCGTDTTNIAKALASTTGWNTDGTSCAVGNEQATNNATGFSALPAGYYTDMYVSFGAVADFWSATHNSSTYAWPRNLYWSRAPVYSYSEYKIYGFSVRCLRDPLAVVTETPSSITDSSATCGGEVIADEGVTVTARGVCWSTSPNPTIADSHTTDGTGKGSFTSSLKGLKPNITYYVRAYAINSEGTSYGSQLSFTAKHIPCPGVPTVTDIDGNVYNTVQIGSQCWMKENLRTTHYADGTYIEKGTAESSETPYRYFPGNANGDTANVSIYGHLYNWPAAMNGAESSTAKPSGVQGICPTGWHMPSYAEWQQLSNYVNSVEDYRCGGEDECIANALSSSTGWIGNITEGCLPGNVNTIRNITGFSAVPAGIKGQRFGQEVSFWSTDGSGSQQARFYAMRGGSVAPGPKFNGGTTYISSCYSVRCLRDPLTATTDSAGTVTNNSATLYGKVTSLGKYTTVKAGFRYGTSADAMTNRTAETEKTANGIYSVTMTGLAPNNTYYFQAYACNGTDTVYGRVMDFTTPTVPCPGAKRANEHATELGIDSVLDVDGNAYITLQIGSQCWMAQNLKTTKYADGTSISFGGTTTSTSTPYRYFPGDDTNNVNTYGHLYNWMAVMNGAGSSNTNPSRVQGICPDGWHVPSDAEFDTLTYYVKDKTEYQCNGTADYIANALSGGTWNKPKTCGAGHSSSATFNKTGFSAVPAGYYNGNGYSSFGQYASFWSATRSVSPYAYYRYFTYGNAGVSTYDCTEGNGFSVRCLRTVVTVTFQPNGAMGAMENQSVTSGVATQLNANAFNRDNAPEKDRNWAFIGWNTKADGTGVSFADQANVTFDSDTTLYAQWHTWCNGTPKTSVNEFGTSRIDSLKDVDNNKYTVVQIGNQCWMKENLRTTTKRENTGNIYTPTTVGYDVNTYGRLYDFAAVMQNASSSTSVPSGVQGICPTGWHVPSEAEWDTLTKYVFSIDDYKCTGCSSSSWAQSTECIAMALAATTGWNIHNTPGTVGYDLSANNATGFSAVPAGLYNSNSGGDGFGNRAGFSSDSRSSNGLYVHTRFLDNNLAKMNRYSSDVGNGYSVRCLRDPLTVVTVTFQPNGAMGAMENQSVTSGVATQLNANAFNRDNAPEKDRNWAFIGWNTKADGTGVSFADQANVTFDSDTTLYAQWHTWCNGTPKTSVNEFGTSRIDSLKDVDNNKYTVVQIGNQCWMKENLRTSKYADGTTTITLGTSSSSITAYRYYPNGSSVNESTYGHLYNWIAVMNGAASSNAKPSGVQGICPTGWHVPSDDEWTALTDYVKGKTEYQCDGTAGNIANALSGGTWKNPSTCRAGHSSSATFNKTGFSAVPAGSYYGTAGYYNFGLEAPFWSATLDNTGNAYTRNLYNTMTLVNKRDYNKHYGFSVRCLRNPESSR